MRVDEAEALPVCGGMDLTGGEPSPRSAPFVDRLVDETSVFHPVSAVVLRPVLARLVAETPTRDLTFVNNDASAGLIVALADAMVWARQLRDEVIEVQMDAVGSIDPGVMVHLMDAQGLLQVLFRQAVEIHARLHAAPSEDG